ncbi:hypothetical protein OUZ56_000724 [Daphnia magna]|uniref:Uncharacterized protein n=1 Tax=Daphnia magna TaxID=35525 RepID=A0ABR0A0J3_9CRUS|nr:hypothetical protein OUZ56_000724 [Daphnia magna]
MIELLDDDDDDATLEEEEENLVDKVIAAGTGHDENHVKEEEAFYPRYPEVGVPASLEHRNERNEIGWINSIKTWPDKSSFGIQLTPTRIAVIIAQVNARWQRET